MGKTLPPETQKLIRRFVEKINKNDHSSERLKKWYYLITKNPVMSVELLELVDTLSADQINYVYNGLVAGLSLTQIKIYAKPEFSTHSMLSISDGLTSGIPQNKIKLYAKLDYQHNNYPWIVEFNKIAPKLDYKTLKKYLKCDLEIWQKFKILCLLADCPDIPEERIDVLCNIRFDRDQYEALINYIKMSDKLTLDQLKFIATPDFSTSEMQEIAKGYLHGLKQKQVMFYAKSDYIQPTMELIRLGFERGFSFRKIYFYTRKEFRYPAQKAVFDCFTSGLSFEEIKVILNISHNSSDLFDDYNYPEKIDLYRQLFNNGLNIHDLQSIASSQTITFHHLMQILNGLENRLPKAKVMYYATSGLNSDQMQEVRIGFEDKLTKRQVKTYAKSEYSSDIMKAIRIRYTNGMSVKEVKEMLETCKTSHEITLYCKTERAFTADLYTIISEQLLSQN